ncbi:MAG: hypothetical protein AB8B55_06235 [Mariniblastus sp.]
MNQTSILAALCLILPFLFSNGFSQDANSKQRDPKLNKLPAVSDKTDGQGYVGSLAENQSSKRIALQNGEDESRLEALEEKVALHVPKIRDFRRAALAQIGSTQKRIEDLEDTKQKQQLDLRKLKQMLEQASVAEGKSVEVNGREISTEQLKVLSEQTAIKYREAVQKIGLETALIEAAQSALSDLSREEDVVNEKLSQLRLKLRAAKLKHDAESKMRKFRSHYKDVSGVLVQLGQELEKELHRESVDERTEAR